MRTGEGANLFRYSAFVSYSHKDLAWAVWLQNALETYQVPDILCGKGIVDERRRRLRPVFRDRDELPSAADLNKAIQTALMESEFLVVVCSPSSAKSAHVEQEVLQFQSLGRADRVMCVIVDGEPNAASLGKPELECFPRPLRSSGLAESGSAALQFEPLAADARPQGDGRRLCKLKLAAGLLGVGLDELRRRDEARQRKAEIRNAVLGGFLALLACLAYFGFADAGINLPGSEPVRIFIDRHDISLLRRILPDDEIRQLAASARLKKIDSLRKSRLADGRYPFTLEGTAEQAENWTSAQALAASCRAPELGARKDEILASFRTLFSQKVLVLDQDKRAVGWSQRINRAPQAPIALWMITALALAIERADVFNSQDRSELEKMYIVATALSDRYLPLNDGGWNMFSDVADPSTHDNYTSVLALQALVYSDRAELNWGGQSGQTQTLLRSTARWLSRSYDGMAASPGWRRMPNDDDDQVFDGLTIQIYATLLAAEAQQGPAISPAMMERITQKLIACGDRSVEFPITTGEFNYNIIHAGVVQSENEAIGFLWYPWAIEASVRWLARNSQQPAAQEDATRVRRTLSNLLRLKELDERGLFRISETLLGLAAVPPPSGGGSK